MQKEKREEIIETTDMVIKLCLMAGSKLSTAYTVGGLFASGLERECSLLTQDAADGVCTCPYSQYPLKDGKCPNCGKPKKSPRR